MSADAVLDRVRRRLQQLATGKAAGRRSAAKWFRKHPDPRLCEPLVAALRKELTIRRAWEGQYHLARAVGASGCRDAVPVLESMLENDELEPMPRAAAVHSLFLLASDDEATVANLFDRCLDDEPEGLLLGVLFATGSLHPPLDRARRLRILQRVREPGVWEHGGVRYLLCAARRWDDPEMADLFDAARGHRLSYVRDDAAKPDSAPCRCDSHIL